MCMAHNPFDACPAAGSVAIKELGRRNLVGHTAVDPPTPCDTTAGPRHFTGEHELGSVVVDGELRKVAEMDGLSLAHLEVRATQPRNQLMVYQQLLYCNLAGDVSQGPHGRSREQFLDRLA